jgi:hypothetical protein
VSLVKLNQNQLNLEKVSEVQFIYLQSGNDSLLRCLGGLKWQGNWHSALIGTISIVVRQWAEQRICKLDHFSLMFDMSQCVNLSGLPLDVMRPAQRYFPFPMPYQQLSPHWGCYFQSLSPLETLTKQ